jgi:enediyne biosynthesis protein E4
MSDTDKAEDAKLFRKRALWAVLFATLVGMGLVAGGWGWWMDRRYKIAMEEIEADIVTGRYAIACRNLYELLSWKTDWNGGLAYLLGSCELARGHSADAAAAWARVAPGLGFSEKAIRGQMRLLHDAGQFAAAERLITDAADDPRSNRTVVRASLVPMFRELGRIEDAARLIEDRWEHLNERGEGALEPAIKLVLEHADLTLKVLPIDSIRAELERAARLAPDDDRVWLGKAMLAIRTGSNNDAARLLFKCQQRRPDDVAVWRARLSLGMATDKVDLVTEAMAHLPDLKSTPAQIHQVEAWLAAHRGDATGERRELESVVADDPADVTSLARLAELAERAGRSAEAANFNRRRAEAERWLVRYRQLLERKQPIRHAQELAQLAEKLGRRFESGAFRTIVIANPSNRKIRAKRPDANSAL